MNSCPCCGNDLLSYDCQCSSAQVERVMLYVAENAALRSRLELAHEIANDLE